MLEIKTIAGSQISPFDKEVNDAIADGWELVRRDCFLVGAHHEPMLYAELERETEPAEAEEPDDDDLTNWVLTRDPINPYRCEKCNFKTIAPIKTGCPNCGRVVAVER